MLREKSSDWLWLLIRVFFVAQSKVPHKAQSILVGHPLQPYHCSSNTYLCQVSDLPLPCSLISLCLIRVGMFNTL